VIQVHLDDQALLCGLGDSKTDIVKELESTVSRGNKALSLLLVVILNVIHNPLEGKLPIFPIKKIRFTSIARRRKHLDALTIYFVCLLKNEVGVEGKRGMHGINRDTEIIELPDIDDHPAAAVRPITCGLHALGQIPGSGFKGV
jgi:hypothetical protein